MDFFNQPFYIYWLLVLPHKFDSKQKYFRVINNNNIEMSFELTNVSQIVENSIKYDISIFKIKSEKNKENNLRVIYTPSRKTRYEAVFDAKPNQSFVAKSNFFPIPNEKGEIPEVIEAKNIKLSEQFFIFLDYIEKYQSDNDFELKQNLLLHFKGQQENITFENVSRIFSVSKQINATPLILADLNVTFSKQVKNRLITNSIKPNFFKTLISIIENEQNIEKDIMQKLVIKVSEIFAQFFLNYNKETFYSLLKEKSDNYFLKGFLALIGTKKLELEQLFRDKTIDKMNTIQFLLENISTRQQIIDILTFDFNLTSTLNLIVQFYDILYDRICKKQSKSFFGLIDNNYIPDKKVEILLPLPIDTDLLDNIINLIKKIKEKEKSFQNNLISINFEQILIGLIAINKNMDLDKFETLYEMIKIIYDIKDGNEFTSKDINSIQIYDKYLDSYHEKALSLAKKGALSNKQVMEIITEKDLFYIKQEYENDYRRDPGILRSFSLIKDENENCFSDFTWEKIWLLFMANESKWKNFVELFMEKIKTISDFQYLFELFPVDIMEKGFIGKMLSKFQDQNFMKSLTPEQLPETEEILFTILKVTAYNNLNCKIVFESLEKTLFSEQQKGEIYCYFINKNDEYDSKEIGESLLKVFSDNLYKFENLYSVVTYIKNKNFLKDLFDSMGNKIVDKNDYYFEVNDNNHFIQLYSNFLKNFTLIQKSNCQELLETVYFVQSQDIAGVMYQDYLSSNFSYSAITSIMDAPGDVFSSRMHLVFSFFGYQGIEEQYKSRYECVKKDYNKVKAKLEETEIIYNFLSKAFRENINDSYYSKILEDLQQLINKLRDTSMKKVEDIQIKNYCKNYSDLLNIVNYSESFIFLEIFNKLRKTIDFKKQCEKLISASIGQLNELIGKLYNFENAENVLSINNIDILLNLNVNIDEDKKLLDKEIKFIIKTWGLDKEFEEKLSKMVVNIINISNAKNCIQIYFTLLESFNEIIHFRKTKFFEDLETFNNAFNKGSVTLDNVNQMSEFLKNQGIDTNDKDNLFFQFLILFTQNKSAISLFARRRVDDIKKLTTYITENNIDNIQLNDIENYRSCCDIIDYLDRQNLDTDIKFNSAFNKFFNERKGVGTKFINYLKCFKIIEDLLNEIYVRPEFTLLKIEYILKYSEIRIFVGNGDEIVCSGTFKNKDKITKKLSKKDFTELRSSSTFSRQWSTSSTGSGSGDKPKTKEEEKAEAQAEAFSNICSFINLILEQVTNLVNSGYPLLIDINFIIKKGELYTKDKKKIVEQEFIKQYEDLNVTLKQSQINAYGKSPISRFLYGKLFYLINEKIDKDKGDISYILKYISNGKFQKEALNFTIDNRQKYKNIFDEIYSNINRFLVYTMKLNKISSIGELFKENYIKENLRSTGMWGLKVINSNFEQSTLILYEKYTGNPPLNNTIYICNKDSSIPEVYSFIIRALTCEYPVLFCLVNFDSLEVRKRYETIELLKGLSKMTLKSKSMMCISYNSNSEILSIIKNLITNKNIDISTEVSKFNYQEYYKNVEIYYSSIPSIILTNEIKKRVLEQNKQYFHMQIQGVFNNKEIAKKINDFGLVQEEFSNTVIHIEIGETSLEQLVDEILFKLLVLSQFSFDDIIFYFGHSIKFIVQLPSNNINEYFQKHPFLRSFKLIDINNLKK